MAQAFELDVELRDASPRVWRRVRVPADLSLADLHRVIQAVMRWDDVHPHVFDVAGREYGPEPEEEEVALHWYGDDHHITVGKVVKKARTFEYTYDFRTEQRVMISVVRDLDGASRSLECLAGEGDAFDAADLTARIAEEFEGAGRAVANAGMTAEERLVADLSLLLLWLTSFEEGRGKRVANKAFRLDILDALAHEGLLVTNIHRKGVELTPQGIRRAQDLLQHVGGLLRP